MPDKVTKIVARALIPFVQVYGLYIILFGDVSPGGGFAGGVVLAAGFILYRLAFAESKEETPWFSKIINYLETEQYFLYTFIGLFSFAVGLTFLAIIFPHPLFNFLGGLFKIGIGFMVAVSVVIIFYTMVKGGASGNTR